MTEHLSNGQFARKEVTESAPDKKTGKKLFQKGGKPGPGRPKGSQNKTTRKVKEFLAALVDNPDVQDAVENRILKGDAVAFFRALEHVLGKPKENEGEPVQIEVRVGWQK